jgi:hypothetical protein
MDVLKPLVASGAIHIVAEPWIEGWDPVKARDAMADALKKTKNVAAVVASNDSTASGAIEALTAAKLAGKVPGLRAGRRAERVPAAGGRHAGDDGLQAAPLAGAHGLPAQREPRAAASRSTAS